MDIAKNKKQLAKTIVYWNIMFLIIGVALRLHGIARGLEYDEIWPLQKFAGKSVWDVLTLLDYTCIHLLNNVLIPFFGFQRGVAEWIYRIPPLLAGLALIPASSFLSWQFVRTRTGAITGAALAAFAPQLVHYSQTARGYIYQALFLTLLLCLIKANRLRKMSPALWTLRHAIVSWLAQASVVSSLIVWLPANGWLAAHGLLQIRRGRQTWREWFLKSTLPIVITGLLLLAWILYMLPAIRSAQEFVMSNLGAAPPRGLVQIASVPVNIIESVFPWQWLLLITASLPLVWRRNTAALAALVLVSCTAFACRTSQAPARAYTYLYILAIPIITQGTSRLLALLRRKLGSRLGTAGIIAPTIVVAIAASPLLTNNPWRGVDYREIADTVIHHCGSDAYPIFPAAAGRIVNYYNAPGIFRNNYLYLAPKTPSKTIILVNQGIIEGYDPVTTGAHPIPLPPDTESAATIINGIRCTRIKLAAIDSNTPIHPNDILAAVHIHLNANSTREENACTRTLHQRGWFSVNPWLTRPVRVRNKKTGQADVATATLYTHRCTSPTTTENDIRQLRSIGADLYILNRRRR